MTKKEDTGFIDRVWNFFASVKLAIVLLITISLTSIIGTVIEQQAAPEENIKVISRLFGESIAPTLYNIFLKMGFMDMYHSWWFVALLLLFCCNLIICSFDRLPRILKIIREPMVPIKDESFKGVAIKRELRLKGNLIKVSNETAHVLKSFRYNFAEIKEGKNIQFLTQKGRYSRLGVYITHFSILLILTGALIGGLFGFKGFLNLPEGETSTVAYSRNGNPIPLGFAIRCNSFDVEYYKNMDMPKAYKSDLSIIVDGKEVERKTIVVNDPLTYNGITFYQSSYGMVPGADGKFILKVVSKNGIEKVYDNLKLGDSFDIPGTSMSAKILDFSPALAINDKTGKPYTYSDELVNPAIYIGVYDKGAEKYRGWILKRYPETSNLPEGHKIEFVDYWGVKYTGLQVRNDPGVWVVYIGCITITLGLIIAFFINHKRLWVRLSEEGGSTRVIFGGSANKNKLAFEREIERMVRVLEGGRK